MLVLPCEKGEQLNSDNANDQYPFAARLKISSDDRVGGPVGVATGKIDRANAAMKRVRPVASAIETGIENVSAVCSRRAIIVNNERKDDRARSRFPYAMFWPQSPLQVP